MDSETKTLIWGTIAMLAGIFGAAGTIIVAPFLALLLAGVAGYALAVLGHNFVKYQWEVLELQYAEAKEYFAGQHRAAGE